jgi:hypothetical protein
VHQSYRGFGEFGAAFMRLKLPPVGVVPPAHLTEPSFLGGPGTTVPGGPQPWVGSEAPQLPGLSPAARPRAHSNSRGGCERLLAATSTCLE